MAGVSTAVEGAHTIMDRDGTLYFINFQTSGAGYLMLFDSPQVPPDGPVQPVNAPVQVGGAGTYTIDYGRRGKQFTKGITIVFSSTGPLVKTQSNTAFFEWEATPLKVQF